jgi:hypothetical protein
VGITTLGKNLYYFFHAQKATKPPNFRPVDFRIKKALNDSLTVQNAMIKYVSLAVKVSPTYRYLFPWAVVCLYPPLSVYTQCKPVKAFPLSDIHLYRQLWRYTCIVCMCRPAVFVIYTHHPIEKGSYCLYSGLYVALSVLYRCYCQ